ncbi:threonine ammonia-lyase [Roseiterribacter gracilis]|uniref:threonine ammonia-lyase n=1 Tax=Roseiterribacter gracilis TaxID=2812848 RepID=UPI003B42F33B
MATNPISTSSLLRGSAAALEPPTYDDVLAASERLAPIIGPTPLLRSRALDARVGGRIFLKAECLQYTGSFKFRGAYNRLVQLDEQERAAGVVAFSSGNHAQGVAAAAALLGMKSVIVMPRDAPAAKIDATRGYGAEVVLYDRWTESREGISAAIAAERGAVLVPPFDDPRIIAGQGTTGLELARQAERFGEELDAAYVPASGGGLIAGVALALAEDSPGTAVYVAEPAGFDDYGRSLEAGHRVENATGISSICDALLSPTPGEITFEVNSRLLAGGVTVSDDEVRRAVAYAARTLKLVVEPGGAVALAALLAGKIDARGKAVALVLSGGNIDPALLADCIGAYPEP